MKRELLKYLACPNDGADLSLAAEVSQADDVLEGAVSCAACGAAWRIRAGIPRFVDSRSSERAAATGAAFAREWSAFSAIESHHRRQFEDWIAPFPFEDFRAKVVLEGGCGKGRHTAAVAESGAAAVVAVDVGDSIDVARENNRTRTNCHFVQADIARLPLKPVFDVVFSIGVLHHMERPLEGARALGRLLEPGGSAVFWVYGRENNGWVVHLVNPLRTRLTSRLPHGALNAVSFLATLPLFAALKTLYRSSGKGLPYGDYLHYISGFPFREVHSIVYDHLLAPTAHYLAREEAVELIEGSGLQLQSARHHNRQSWTVIGTKPLRS